MHVYYLKKQIILLRRVNDTYTTRVIKQMARPKRLENPTKLTLVMDESTRAKAHKLAFKRDISLSRLFVEFIESQPIKK